VFDKFAESSRNVMQLARNESIAFNHGFVGTEHILLGLICEDKGIAAAVLRQFNVQAETVRSKIEEYAPATPDSPLPELSKPLPFSPLTKKSLEAAVRQAATLGHNYIGTEHLLLGILNVEENTACKILISLGIDLGLMAAEVIEMISVSDDPGYEAAPTASKEEKATPVKPKPKANKNSALYQFGRDLTQMASDGLLDPVIGRDDEIERIILVLARRSKNNPILLGEAGVGKTAIVEGIAQKIANGQVPEIIAQHRVISLDLAGMVAGTKYRGQFEERIKAVMAEAIKAKNIILFVDEIHNLVGAGAAEGAIDAANVLKPALSRGELQCVGATTLEEYRKSIEKDGALARRFQKIFIEPPTRLQTIEILAGLQDRYEAHHHVTYSSEAVSTAVNLADRYITNRFLPDKAIDVLDEAGARLALETFRPVKLQEIDKEIARLLRSKEEAVVGQNFELAATARDELAKARRKKELLKSEWRKAKNGKESRGVVTPDLIALTVSKMTGVPVNNLTATEAERLLAMEAELDNNIIGQAEPKRVLAKALRRSRSGLKNPKRPIGCFLFMGPTGVGKTLMAKSVAKFMFGSEDNMISVDMSEYMEKHNVSRLIGAPPGYIGFDEGGTLTESIRRKPYSVVLFDEIEKAHPEVFNIFLQVMEEGHLTDSSGRKIDFCNTIVIFTSNAGSDAIKNKTALGFGKSEGGSPELIRKQVEGALSHLFRVEFLNRLDGQIIFTQLSKDELKKILVVEMDKVSARLAHKHITLELTPAAADFLLAHGWNPEMGARPLRRAVETFVEDLLAEELLKGLLPDSCCVQLDAVTGCEKLKLSLKEKMITAV